MSFPIPVQLSVAENNVPVNVTLSEQEGVSLGVYTPIERAMTQAEWQALMNDKADIIISSATGEIASFPDGANNLPVVSLAAGVNPVQDLHGYSNPWPAGGGKNMLPPLSSPVTNKGVTFSSNNAGEYVLTGTATANAYCNIFTGSLPAGEYTINGLPGASNGSYRIRILINGTAVGYNSDIDRTITVSEGDSVTIQLFAYPEYGAFNGLTLRYQLESGSAVTDWTPYSNICPISGRTGLSVYVSPTQDQQDATTYTSDWTAEAGTVYGGTLDIVTGVLTVDREMVDMGTMAWDKVGRGYYSTSINKVVKKGSDTYGYDNAISSQYESVNIRSIAGLPDFGLSVDTGGNVQLKDSRYATAAELKSGLDGVQLCYELATPVTYQLTAQEVKTLLGQNYVWSNNGGVIAITYRADTKLYIDNKIAQAIAAAL